MGESLKGKSLEELWKVNTIALFKEIVENNEKMGIFKQPINIFGRILEQVAARAIELNDPQLNRLMCRLALYESSDPYSASYDQKAMDIVFSDDYINKEKESTYIVASSHGPTLDNSVDNFNVFHGADSSTYFEAFTEYTDLLKTKDTTLVILAKVIESKKH